MKRAGIFTLLLLITAGYLSLRTAPAPRQLASLMPGGALLYIESPDFGGLLSDWDRSKVKAGWLQSVNFAGFSRSNLFTKLQEVYGHYGAAAGFLPSLASVAEIAGGGSALALYEIRDVEFLYVTRITDASLMKSQLWAVREQFQQRQSGGVTFYLRTDPASRRTVAFAFTNNYLFLATRDDLVAQALELLAGGQNPNLAADRWYREAVAASARAGELRLVMNLESLVKSVYFRSYWVQRNVSVIRRYWAGVADLSRGRQSITETRVFLRTPERAGIVHNDGAVSGIAELAPPEGGLYRAWRASDPAAIAALIVQKLIRPPAASGSDECFAPAAVGEGVAGSEGDLESRIDEEPLPSSAGVAQSITALRALADRNDGRATLLVQSSAAVGGPFVVMPSVMVLEGAGDWNATLVRDALRAAAGQLWTVSGIGVTWVTDRSTRYAFDRLNGLGPLLCAVRGHYLYLGNDLRLFTAVLDRSISASAPVPLTYTAGFRHLQERPNYQRIMTALDFKLARGMGRGDMPAFFSDNIASLSQVLSQIQDVRVSREERDTEIIETVEYQMAR